MKKNLAEAKKVIRSAALAGIENISLAFSSDNPLDVTGRVRGSLYLQDEDFVVVEDVIASSRRVGPSQVSPTRYFGDLYITYFTKNPNPIVDLQRLEDLADIFSEKSLDDVRFRTFTPFDPRMDNGFTAISGVVAYDFELYRTVR